MQVTFRYSDSDFAAYLMSIGYQYQEIEITKDRKGKFKAFIHFSGDREKLIKLYDDYSKGNTKIDPLQFATNRRKLNSVIKDKCSSYIG